MLYHVTIGARTFRVEFVNESADEVLQFVELETIAGSDDWEARVEMPREFVVPGETRASSALEVARTIVRRSERRVIALGRSVESVAGGWTVPYLNRLADLLWVLARAGEQSESRSATPARRR